MPEQFITKAQVKENVLAVDKSDWIFKQASDLDEKQLDKILLFIYLQTSAVAACYRFPVCVFQALRLTSTLLDT